MKRLLTAILACLVIFITLGSSAEAAPIRECGNSHHGYVVNITARKFTCRQARAIVSDYIAHGNRAHMLHATVNYNTGTGYSDVRLWDSYGYVVRFHMAQD